MLWGAFCARCWWHPRASGACRQRAVSWLPQVGSQVVNQSMLVEGGIRGGVYRGTTAQLSELYRSWWILCRYRCRSCGEPRHGLCAACGSNVFVLLCVCVLAAGCSRRPGAVRGGLHRAVNAQRTLTAPEGNLPVSGVCMIAPPQSCGGPACPAAAGRNRAGARIVHSCTEYSQQPVLGVLASAWRERS